MRDAEPADAVAGADAPGWFPVVDRERCSDCGQCLEFCLFGVYARDAAGRVAVVAPGNCKDGCPACARICPQGAIAFPRHADPAVNGTLRPPPGQGLPPDADLMSALRTRRARTRLLRADTAAALAERTACAAAADGAASDGACSCSCSCPGQGSPERR